ncbi:AAA family ATPase [Paenibacillus lentus]|uniref:AAA family ATPase n=1 Tax=Paenibacillus lentus TaxID=1338368 RepID=A0A3Q8S3S9_9BACL|nr:AAA family ATPase [Paenibacillus lentus]AZK45397.1 AAA family ATPase [Paenibacillus lentus]
MSATITIQQYHNLRNEFRKYLQGIHPEWNESTLSTRMSDAFFALNNDIGVDFWAGLASEESMLEVRDHIHDYFAYQKKYDSPDARADYYLSSLRLLKSFLDENYPSLPIDWSGGRITKMYLRSEFQSWMRNQKKSNGEPYSPKTISQYSSSLKNSTAKLNLVGEIHHDLFNYFSYDEFEEVREVILAAPNFEEVDLAAGNKAYSNGMKMYARFLKELSENAFTDMVAGEPEIEYPDYSVDDFLNEVYMTEERYRTLKGLLLRKKNVILQGAPGVGKTYAAQRLAFSIMGKKDRDRVRMVQFHQSYSYEDFIMGYRPEGNAFVLTKGPFYEFCKRAKEDDREHFFIIDEINRGNLSKIFGELLMLIENDKRGEDNAIRLLYKDELFSVPDNVHIIGMMNTADRSLAMIDYALRRRFAFFEIEPAFATEGFRAYQMKVNNTKFDALIGAVVKLNAAIVEDASLGSGFQIGHSYFCTAETIDDAWLSEVVDYELLPLLHEYWFDDPSKVEHWISALRGAIRG